MSLSRVSLACVCLAGLLAAAPPSWADLTPYSQNFEGLAPADPPTDPSALSNDGWLVFGNVFDSGGTFKFGYGPFGAPNGGQAFSAVDTGQGGPPQGNNQLSVYNDYGCCGGPPPDEGHGNGTDKVESNVFQEQTIGAADVGKKYVFRFDAKKGNITGSTTALAFIKTLDPGAGFALTNFVTQDTTSLPTVWGTFFLSLTIDAGLVGQILQFGFASTASNFVSSGNFYDNVNFAACGTDIVVSNSMINTPQEYQASNTVTFGPDLIVEAADPGVIANAKSVVFDGSNAGVVVGDVFTTFNFGCGGP